MSVKIILTLLTIAVLAKGQLSTNSSVQDYIARNQRQYDAVIPGYDEELAVFRSHYNKRANAILELRDLLILKIEESVATINPLEVLNDKTKACVREYRAGIPIPEATGSQISNCVSSVASSINSYLNAAITTRNTLYNYYNNNLRALLNNCANSSSNSVMNYTLCVTSAISTVNTYTNNNRKQFAAQIQQAHCASDTRINQALECSFNVMNDAIRSNSAALTLIEQCIRAVPYECTPCSNEIAGGESCQNVVNVSYQQSDFNNATIVNPFYGLNSDLSCVLFKFSNSLVPSKETALK